MHIGIGNDHVAVDMKLLIKAYLESKGHTVTDFGTAARESSHYPIYGSRVARAVASGKVDCGIVICGTGIGIGLAANRVPGIRCATCSDPYSARMAKEHNNCNMLAFGARVVGSEVAKMLVDEWLNAKYEQRHQVRLDMLDKLAKGEEIE
jgi:ribose 5-phosphate isomerase B